MHADDIVPERDAAPRLFGSVDDQEARADTLAGTGVPVEEVAAWIESWGSKDERPVPEARPIA